MSGMKFERNPDLFCECGIKVRFPLVERSGVMLATGEFVLTLAQGDALLLLSRGGEIQSVIDGDRTTLAWRIDWLLASLEAKLATLGVVVEGVTLCGLEGVMSSLVSR